MSTNKEQCFVIMPFSETKNHSEEYWTNHFEKFLKPLVEQTGLFKAHRSEPLRGDVLRTIITNLIKAHIVVADVTDANPNVYWELGVRQSFKNGTITIAEIGTEIPFDLSIKGILWYYPQDHIKNANFEKQFQAAIRDFMANPNSPDSQVLDTISGRGTFYEIIQKEETLRKIDGLVNEALYNKILAKTVLEQIAEKKGIKNVCFQSCSLELLLTHRYLDQPSEFYTELRGVYLQILFDNSTYAAFGENCNQIMRHYSPNKPDDWKNRYTESTISKFDKLVTELKTIRGKIEASY